ncbi:MAG: endonuclease V [Acidobacteria bacterium]|nr:endonuclease V [Acidobacteriota bacterium]
MRERLLRVPGTTREAIEVQLALRDLVKTDLVVDTPGTVAGVDVAYIAGERISVATVVVLRFSDLALVESVSAWLRTPFPYVPGLLGFREAPPVLEAWERLRLDPDMVFVDGHGRAHPRRFGVACHIGMLLRKPTVGIGKSRLCGCCQEPGPNRGERADLVDEGAVVGTVLRTRDHVKPLFVSVGYGISLERCVEWTLKTTRGVRLPEPLRLADQASRKARLDRVQRLPL